MALTEYAAAADLAAPATSIAANRFRAMTPDEVRAEAERRLRAQDSSFGRTVGGPGVAVGFLVAGLIGLCVPGAGVLLLLGAIVCAIWAVVDRPRLNGEDQHTLDVLCAKLQTNVIGKCPGCQTQIILKPDPPGLPTACPLCSTQVRFQDGYVRALSPGDPTGPSTLGRT